MLRNVGLDPDYKGNPDGTPEEVAAWLGVMGGQAVVKGRENDGMNQLGTEGGRDFNPLPYADYTGYKPKNTAYEVTSPSRWQPDL